MRVIIDPQGMQMPYPDAWPYSALGTGDEQACMDLYSSPAHSNPSTQYRSYPTQHSDQSPILYHPIPRYVSDPVIFSTALRSRTGSRLAPSPPSSQSFPNSHTHTDYMCSPPKMTRWACNACGVTFSRKHDLKRHCGHNCKHAPQSAGYSCRLCGRKLRRTDSVKRHTISCFKNMYLLPKRTDVLRYR